MDTWNIANASAFNPKIELRTESRQHPRFKLEFPGFSEDVNINLDKICEYF